MNTQKEIVPFDFEGSAVRSTLIGGEPWFVAKDVCDILGLGNPTETMRNFPENERNTLSNTEGIHEGPGNPNVNIVNEPGLYRLIFQSRKPEAERFKTWVFTEVLPSIRRTGKYALPGMAWELSSYVLAVREDAPVYMREVGRLVEAGVLSPADGRALVMDRRASKETVQNEVLRFFAERNFIHTGDLKDYIVIAEAYRRYSEETDDPLSQHAFTRRIRRLFGASISEHIRRVNGTSTRTFPFFKLRGETDTEPLFTLETAEDDPDAEEGD
jgi:hypothetical protein